MAKSKHTTITRRVAIGGAVAAGTVALAIEAKGRVAPAVAAVPTTDPHPAWLERRETADAIRVRRFTRLERRYGHDGKFPSWLTAAWGKEERRSLDERDRLTGLIMNTRTHTPEGMAAKAYLLWFEGEIGASGDGASIALGLIADLHRMASRPLTDFEAGGFAKARAVFGDKTPVQEYRELTDQVVQIAGRLDELEPQLAGKWIRLTGAAS